MQKQIVHLSVHQTSKVIAVMHAAMMSVLFVLPTVLGHFFHKQIISGLLILILVPLFIWLFMYIGYVIACWFYNLVVPWTGGIEIEVVDAPSLPQRIEKSSEENVARRPDKIDVPSEKQEPPIKF